MLRVLVSDPSGRFINGLRPTDFRIFEDGIEQTVFTFAEGVRPLMPVSDDGVARRWIYPQPVRTGKSAWTESTYTITYYPDRSNLNNGFRRISIQIVPDGKGRWTVRHMPGYLP